MTPPQNVIAVIFDFDDTLTDDSTSELLKEYKIDPTAFWKQQTDLTEHGWDPTLAFLKLLLDNVGENRPFGNLSNNDLRKFGERLKFYPGIPGLFNSLRTEARRYENSNPKIEFYVISGGLEEIIRGSKIANKLDGIYGCQLEENQNGIISHIKRSISFTEKTRYLFEINKGIKANRKKASPYDVNEAVTRDQRRIPFEHMIYVGDGLTDIPCFSTVAVFGGQAFGVFDPTKADKPKTAYTKLVAPDRVKSVNSPKYRKTDALGALLRAAVAKICADLELRATYALNPDPS